MNLGEDKFLFGRIVNSNKGPYIDGSRNISYSRCLEIIKSKVKSLDLNPALYATHSCRSGAATALASRVTPFELLVTGRWADSRSLNNYVEIHKDRRYEISEELFI